MTEHEFQSEYGIDIIVFDLLVCMTGLVLFLKRNMYQKKIQAHDGIDLILYCKRMDATNANNIIAVEKDIIQKLTEGLGKLG